VPFYYIEYAIAQIGALQVYKNYAQNPDKAVTDYIAGLSMGIAKPMPEVWNTMNINFDFSENTLSDLMTFVRKDLEQYE